MKEQNRTPNEVFKANKTDENESWEDHAVQVGLYVLIVCVLFPGYLFHLHMKWRLDMPAPKDAVIETSFASISVQESTSNTNEKQRRTRKWVALTAMGEIRAKEPHPGSIRWDSIRTDEKPDIVCVQYRSHHGLFSKEVRTTRRKYLVDHSSLTTRETAWDGACESVLIDVTSSADLSYQMMHRPLKHR